MTAQPHDSIAETISETLARYVTELRFEDLPEATREAARGALLDQLGIMLMGSTLEWTQPLYRLTQDIGGSGEATVIGKGDRFGAVDAAAVNANFAHSCELDDSGHNGGAHSGALSVPVSLALCEERRLSGRDLLLGIVTGYELLYRVGRVMTRPAVEIGFHHQSVVGPFGVTAAAARLLGLSRDDTAQALAIAGSHSSGTMEYDQAGGEVKRYHNAMATRAGIVSAMLARNGLTGPRTIFEGRRGVARLFSRVEDPSLIIDGLDDRSWFAVEGRTMKTYPTVGTVPTSIQALTRLMEEHGFTADEVERIDVWIQPHALQHGGAVLVPTDTLSAQFSLAFSLGLRLVRGRNDLRDYMDPSLWRDPAILRVGQILHLHGDPRYGKKDEKKDAGQSVNWKTVQGARLRVELADGRAFEHEELHRKGSPAYPMTEAEQHDKFRGLASAVLDERSVERVIEAVGDIEALDDVGALMKLMRPA